MALDERFAKVLTDPRFKRISKKERKVKIDSRFEKMFTDKRFHTKYSVDKRGKPLHETEKEDLHKFYEIEKEEEAVDDQLQQKSQKKGHPKEGKKIKKKIGTLKTKERDIEEKRIDFNDIRGEGLNGSDSDSSSDIIEIADEDLEEGIVHGWGNLDDDAKRIENAETARLAVCNLDWDRITANDLFVLFNSFKPTGGIILSVKIYPSEFGIERMKEEELTGPQELKDTKLPDDQDGDRNEDDDDDNIEGSKYHMEKLREYQLKRMKYYYAVVECDSKETADKLYEECDGMEYEMSSTRLDLRFIPNDMEFEHAPKSEAHEMPNAKHYQPVSFLNTALQQSTVRLTWDEDDPKRLLNTMKKFTQDDLENMDFKEYLASSSDEEEREEEQETDNKNETKNEEEETDESDEEDLRIKKYRLLMQEIESKEKGMDENEEDLDMEVAWDGGGGGGGDDSDDVGDWENQDDKEEILVDDGSSEEEEVTHDPFFETNDTEESNIRKGKNKEDVKNMKKKKKMKKIDDKNLTEEEKKQKNELELLLLDESEDKKHFNYKDILEQEKRKKSKKKRRKHKKEILNKPEDTFEVDVTDDRFKALYSSHLYALDPSEPVFKKSKATDAIIKEVHRRRIEGKETEDHKENQKEGKIIDSSLSALVKSVKSKSVSHQAALKKKKKLK